MYGWCDHNLKTNILTCYDLGLFVGQQAICSCNFWENLNGVFFFFQFLEALGFKDEVIRSAEQQIGSVREVTRADYMTLTTICCISQTFLSPEKTKPHVCMQSAFVHMKMGHPVQAVLRCEFSQTQRQFFLLCDLIIPKRSGLRLIPLIKQTKDIALGKLWLFIFSLPIFWRFID